MYVGGLICKYTFSWGEITNSILKDPLSAQDLSYIVNDDGFFSFVGQSYFIEICLIIEVRTLENGSG